MVNTQKALKSGVWYTVSNFFLKSIGFITVPIFTRILSKTEFGLFNNFTSWLSIATIFITYSLGASLINARFDYEDEFDEYILSLIALNSISVCFWAFFINIFSAYFVEFTHIDLIYLNAMLIYIAFSTVLNFFQERERYMYQYKISVCLSIGIAVITAFLSVILVLNMSDKLTGRIFGMVIPVVVAGTMLILFFIVKGKKIKIKYWLYALPICLPYIPHLLAGSFLNTVDRVMIERICGAEDTAIYSLAYNCGGIVTLLVGSLNTAFGPWLGEMFHQKQYSEIKQFSRKYVLVFFLLVIVLMLIAPDILYVLGGEPYMKAKYVITPVVMGCVCQFLYTMYVNVEQLSKKTVGMALATVVAAAVNYVLNYLFIPIYGYLVAAYTTLVGFLVLLIIHMYLVRRIGLKDVYDNKFVLLMVLIGTIVMFGITILYSFNIWRYVVSVIYIVLIGILGYRYWETAKIFFKRKV